MFSARLQSMYYELTLVPTPAHLLLQYSVYEARSIFLQEMSVSILSFVQNERQTDVDTVGTVGTVCAAATTVDAYGAVEPEHITMSPPVSHVRHPAVDKAALKAAKALAKAEADQAKALAKAEADQAKQAKAIAKADKAALKASKVVAPVVAAVAPVVAPVVAVPAVNVVWSSVPVPVPVVAAAAAAVAPAAPTAGTVVLEADASGAFDTKHTAKSQAKAEKQKEKEAEKVAKAALKEFERKEKLAAKAASTAAKKATTGTAGKKKASGAAGTDIPAYVEIQSTLVPEELEEEEESVGEEQQSMENDFELIKNKHSTGPQDEYVICDRLTGDYRRNDGSGTVLGNVSNW